MDILISAIVPVYNTSNDAIDRLIESIHDQYFSEYEVIFIDDGSLNETAQKLDDVCKMYANRMKCVHQSNKGVSAARNVGIGKAVGEYVTFIDADDYISPDFFSKAYEYAKKYNADVVYGTIDFVPREPLWVQKKDDTLDIYTNDRIKYLKSALLGYRFGTDDYIVLGSPCGRIFKRDIAEQILFDEKISFYEDQLFNRKVLNIISCAVVCGNVWYYYVQNDDSALHQARSKNDFLSKIKPYWDELLILNKEDDELLFNSLLNYMYTSFLFSDAPVFEKEKQMKLAVKHPIIRDAIYENDFNRIMLRTRDKIALFMIKHQLFKTMIIAFELYFKNKSN